MMATDCLFCKIIAGDIPSEKVFENDNVLGFKDIQPQAATHLLFIHKDHTKDVFEMAGTKPEQVSQIFAGVHGYAAENGYDAKGFRLVTNNGKSAGQTVFHTHFHFLSDAGLGSFGN